MKEKKCFKCGKTKRISEFYKHPNTADGYLGKCKECTRSDTKKNRESFPNRYYETRLNVHAKNPSKTNARKVIEAALMAGRIKKPDRCQGCGRSTSETQIGAHHYDYEKPLDVIWLCAACHRPIDHVRAYVEDGNSWGEYSKQRNKMLCLIERALVFYRDNGNIRKEFDVREVLRGARL